MQEMHFARMLLWMGTFLVICTYLCMYQLLCLGFNSVFKICILSWRL